MVNGKWYPPGLLMAVLDLAKQAGDLLIYRVAGLRPERFDRAQVDGQSVGWPVAADQVGEGEPLAVASDTGCRVPRRAESVLHGGEISERVGHPLRDEGAHKGQAIGPDLPGGAFLGDEYTQLARGAAPSGAGPLPVRAPQQRTPVPPFRRL